MSQFKARVDFTQEQDGNLSAPAHNIHTQMVANAATFTAPPMTMAAFLAIIDAWDTALAASANRGKSEITAKNNARLDLEGALRNLGHYVNTVANGVQKTVEQSGFPGYDTHHARAEDKGPVSNVTFVPKNLRLSHGAGTGVVGFRWESDASGSGCELQTTTGDPNTEAGWAYRGSFSGGKADIGGFTPGQNIWGRVRKIGRHGETGPWSDPATIMVT
jgi:hypothetical protein